YVPLLSLPGSQRIVRPSGPTYPRTFCGACGACRSFNSAKSDRCFVRTWTPSAAVKNPSTQPVGSVPPVGTRGMTRHAPFSNVAGTRPPSDEWMTISSGCANSCTCAPESAQYAVTSSASGPGPKPFVRPLGAAVGAMRTTIQSLLPVDHAPAGTV